MIEKRELWEEFESNLRRNSPKPDYWENLRIFEAMYQHARQLGALPDKNPLRGIETKIRIARVINSV